MSTLPITGIAVIVLPLICIIVTLCVNWKPIWEKDLGHKPRKASKAERAHV